MTAASDPTTTAAPPPLPAVPGAADGTLRWSRWSDRLNPILVREVQQSIKGRVFALSVLTALAITVAIAAAAAGGDPSDGRAGRDAFHAGLATLMPLVLFVVPMQAYQSMRLELRGGIVEQLLLSRLRPMDILLGKLQAALVQFVLYVAVVAPLLATSYLLRGVDVPVIGASLLFAVLGCVVATSIAVSSAAQGMLPGLQPLANLATAFGLGLGCFGFVGFVLSGQYSEALGWVLRSDECWNVLSAMTLLTIAGSTLSLLVARSFLLHAFENKATPFRVLLFVVPGVAFAWLAIFVEPGDREHATPLLTYGLLVLGIVFGVFMLTEQRELSPRLRMHAPRGVRAVLAAPFLPGRDRGTACLCLFLALLAAIATWGWPVPSGPSTSGLRDEVARVGAMTAAYALTFLGLARWLRGRLPAGLAGNHLARFLLPCTVFLFVLTPLLIDVFVHGEVPHWHLGHALNPFWTTAEFALRDDRWPLAAPWVRIALLVVFALQLPACWRGVREVLAAGAARARRTGG